MASPPRERSLSRHAIAENRPTRWEHRSQAVALPAAPFIYANAVVPSDWTPPLLSCAATQRYVRPPPRTTGPRGRDSHPRAPPLSMHPSGAGLRGARRRCRYRLKRLTRERRPPLLLSTRSASNAAGVPRVVIGC